MDKRTDPISLAEVQAMMWNHVLTTPRATAKVNYDEMAGLVVICGPRATRRPAPRELAFAKKGCAACHADSAKGAPILNERDLSPVSLIAAVSTHGPAMRAEMKSKSLVWPRSADPIARHGRLSQNPQPSVPKQASSGAAGAGFPLAASMTASLA